MQEHTGAHLGLLKGELNKQAVSYTHLDVYKRQVFYCRYFVDIVFSIFDTHFSTVDNLIS